MKFSCSSRRAAWAASVAAVLLQAGALAAEDGERISGKVAVEFYVSPNGSDSNPGDRDHPFASLDCARRAVAQRPGRSGPVTVFLAGGTYYLPDTLVFQASDSGTRDAPVTYAALPGQTPVISGGQRLELAWSAYKDGAMQSPVPPGTTADQLFVNGLRQVMARYPDYDPGAAQFNGTAADAFSADRAARWGDPNGGFMHAMHSALWGDMHYRITGKDAQGNLTYVGGWQNNRQSRPHRQFRFVENIFEELDAPSEWFLNTKTHTLYVYPPGGVQLDTAVIEIVRLRHLIVFQGTQEAPVRFIHLQGITFREAARTFMDNREPLLRSDWTTYRGGAIFFNGAEDCTIQGATIDQVGGNAVFINKYNRRIMVKDSIISDAGANGIAFVGSSDAVRSPLFEYGQTLPVEKIDRMPGPKTDDYPADCLVDDCLITRTGRFEKQTAPVQMAMAMSITVRHCSIYDVPRAGINICDGCWGGHTIEYCDVFDTVKETGDHGSFNSWGRDRFWLPSTTAVSQRVSDHPDLPLLDAIKPTTIANSRWRCDHGWDIDLDDGSSNYRIFNNLLLNGGLKNREGYYRTVENNILLGERDGTFHPHVWYTNSGDVFRHNIVSTGYKPIGMPRGPWGKLVDNNILQRPGHAVPEPAVVLQQASGRDEHSILADVLLADPARGDYRVKDDSPGLKLGFKNFRQDSFGVTHPRLRALARTPFDSAAGSSTTVDDNDRDPAMREFLGAKVRNVIGLGEISAYGLAGEVGVLLVQVPVGSVADRAGLHQGDVILQCGDKDIRGWEDLFGEWGRAEKGTPMTLGLWRLQRHASIRLRVDQPSSALRETLSLDPGWRFHLGDIPLNSYPGGEGIRLYGADITHSGAMAGHAWGAAARGFDDTGWQQVDLPHDWVVEQPFDEKAFKQQGYRQRGIAWYRRTFKLNPSDRGKNIELQFDGVASHCTVYFNGTPVHHNFCGYTSFTIDVTSMVRYGNAINTIAVRVDAEAMEGWWYEGGGLYRHTWLVKRSPVHVVTDGVYANPIKAADGTWTIPAEVTLANTGADPASASVDMDVYDAAGKRIAGGRSPALHIVPMGDAVAKVSIPVASPQLWSVDYPNLYTVRTTVLSDNRPVDAVDTPCGFRTIRFDAKEGFFLNDQPLKLQGTCNHQDHAGVGVAVPDSIQAFRVRQLKEMGSNALRTAHNPPSRELLELCDRLGMLVMDETRHFNTSPEYLKQLTWLVRRDRNHPSVILWSLFNEQALEVNEEGMEMTRVMNAVVKRLDTTRPTTGGQNKGQLGRDGQANPTNAAWTMDVVGINYQATDYDKIRAAYPDKPMLSTEDTSQIMTRGEYVTDRARHIVGSYDDVFQGWDRFSSARQAWAAIARQPSFCGGFSWTGYDYRGEPTPYGWPSASSYFGAMDLCGFPKTEFYIRQALWVKDRPVLTLVPHWNWPGREGQPVRVMVLANGETVELFLNGKSLGEKPVDPFEMVSWEIPYVPGKLEAIGKYKGSHVSNFTVETTGEPVSLRLTPDRKSLAGDGCDAIPVTVEALDREGRPVPTANLMVEFEISGPGAIIGLGNGDPTSHEPEKGNRRSLFNGLAQVIVQSRRDGSGTLVLRANADGLKSTESIIRVETAPIEMH